VEGCRDGCPSGRFSHLHRGTLELGERSSLAGRPALGRVLVVPNVFHLRMMEATVFLGTFNAAKMFWYPSCFIVMGYYVKIDEGNQLFNTFLNEAVT
jgi:hypothetical protein